MFLHFMSVADEVSVIAKAILQSSSSSRSPEIIAVPGIPIAAEQNRIQGSQEQRNILMLARL